MELSAAMPALSIVTPVYNGEAFIRGCIESVAAQCRADIEHIVIDGGSTDRTPQILSDAAAAYPHLRWISEPDRGQSDALNKGVAMARAEYIGVLNVDDFYEPGALAHVIELIGSLSAPKFIVGACNLLVDGDKIAEVNRPSVLKFENMLIDSDRWPFPINPSAYFYPKTVHEIIGPYNIDEHFGMDLEFIFAIVQAIEPIYIDVVLGNYRRIAGTKTFEAMADGSHVATMRKVRRAAWRKAPFETKLRIAALWAQHRAQLAYWEAHRRYRSLSRSAHGQFVKP